MPTVEVTSTTFDAEVLQSPIPVLVDFWAPWCGPCRAMAPVLETVAEEGAGVLKVVKLNLQENAALGPHYHVSNIPLLVLFKSGTEVARRVGNTGGIGGLREFLRTHLG